MKATLIFHMALPCLLVCFSFTGFSQNSHYHSDQSLEQPNISGYGTTIIHYHFPDTSVRVVDEGKLFDYLKQFEEIDQIVINSDSIEIHFTQIKNQGQVDLLFERVEMLYLTRKK